jgi:hypothetical protein
MSELFRKVIAKQTWKLGRCGGCYRLTDTQDCPKCYRRSCISCSPQGQCLLCADFLSGLRAFFRGEHGGRNLIRQVGRRDQEIERRGPGGPHPAHPS